MKIKIIAFVCLILGAFSCNKKDNFNYAPGTVGISRITYFPILTLIGANPLLVVKNTTFTDPGVTAKEGSTPLTYTTSGTVNTAQTGVYTLTYTAVNKDGFSASIRRTVVVYSTDATASSHDLSGRYLRASTGQYAVWTMLAPGVYQIDNPGGAVGVNLQVIALNPTGYSVSIPTQISSDGNTSSSTNFNYVNGPVPSYTLIFNNPGYGTSTRSFVKQ